MAGNTGNTRDNRQRGNATQLLEKYKSLARDAQLAGDRVQTEYYLQFADHYFRVLGESRVRFEEQRRQRGDDDDDGYDDDGEEMAEADAEAETSERPQPRNRDDRPQRRERFERPERQERAERPQRAARANGRDRVSENREEPGERIAFDVLPPAIGADSNEPPSDAASEAPAAKPRRARRPKVEDNDGDIAPAA